MPPRRQWTASDGTTHYSELISFGSDKTARAVQRPALKAVRELDERTP
jgi:hypothetical protein